MAAALVLVAALSWWILGPPSLSSPTSRPAPAADYEEALARIDALRQADREAAPGCRLRLMTHGRRTARGIVLFHGLTNCPQQFEVLGRILYDAGDNVLIVRLPHHGLADRMTTDLRHLRASAIAAAGEAAVDAAHGLGERVVVAGLSLGGNAAAWIAEHRADVDRVVVIAPVLGLATVWAPLTFAVAKLLLALPNQFLWWDPAQREALGPPHVYPRYATRALAETLRLGLIVASEARRSAPAARSIVLVTVGGDRAVRNAAAYALARDWGRHPGSMIERYEFPRSLHLDHDLIDPLQPHARTDIVYPTLVRIIRG